MALVNDRAKQYIEIYLAVTVVYFRAESKGVLRPFKITLDFL